MKIKNTQDARNEASLIDGNISRMFLTDNMKELGNSYYWAVSRICELYLFHRNRIEFSDKEKE